MHSEVQTAAVTIISYKPLSNFNFARYTGQYGSYMSSFPLRSIKRREVHKLHGKYQFVWYVLHPVGKFVEYDIIYYYGTDKSIATPDHL